MSRLLLPLEHPNPAAEHHADDALLHALRRLPRRVQQVFLLNRLDQLDFAIIAARLDLPLASIERHMDQALQAGRSRRDVLASVAGQWYVRLQSPQVTACERIDFAVGWMRTRRTCKRFMTRNCTGAACWHRHGSWARMVGTGKVGRRCRWAAVQLRSGLAWRRWCCLVSGPDQHLRDTVIVFTADGSFVIKFECWSAFPSGGQAVAIRTN